MTALAWIAAYAIGSSLLLATFVRIAAWRDRRPAAVWRQADAYLREVSR